MHYFMMGSPAVRILSPLKVETWKPDTLTPPSLAIDGNKESSTQDARHYVIIMIPRDRSRDADSKDDIRRLPFRIIQSQQLEKRFAVLRRGTNNKTVGCSTDRCKDRMMHLPISARRIWILQWQRQ